MIEILMISCVFNPQFYFIVFNSNIIIVGQAVWAKQPAGAPLYSTAHDPAVANQRAASLTHAEVRWRSEGTTMLRTKQTTTPTIIIGIIFARFWNCSQTSDERLVRPDHVMFWGCCCCCCCLTRRIVSNTVTNLTLIKIIFLFPPPNTPLLLHALIIKRPPVLTIIKLLNHK